MRLQVKSRRQTPQQAFRWAVERYAYPTSSDSVKGLRFERSVWRHHEKKLKRDSVGFVRCMGAPNFFRGCYVGAEND